MSKLATRENRRAITKKTLRTRANAAARAARRIAGLECLGVLYAKRRRHCTRRLRGKVRA